MRHRCKQCSDAWGVVQCLVRKRPHARNARFGTCDMQHVLCNEHCGCASAQHLVAIVACSCGRRHVEMRCVDMCRLQLSCMSHSVAIFACLVHTARGSTVALSALHPGHSCRFSFLVEMQHLQSADNWPKVSRRDSNDPPFEMRPRFCPP